MLLKHKFSIQLILFFVWIGSITYSIIYYLGLHKEGELLAKTTHLSINTIIFAIIFSSLFIQYRTYKKIKLPRLQVFWLFFAIILLMSFESIIQLKFKDVIPSLIRFLNYFGIFILAYNIRIENNAKFCISIMKPFIMFSIISCIGFGFYEIYIDDIQYLNNAYRLSGSFKFHQLANGMYLFTIIACAIFFKLNRKNKLLKNIIYAILILLLTYLFLRVHSRLLFLSLFSTLLVLFFIGTNRILVKFNIILATVYLLIAGLFLMFNFDFQPRLKNLLFSSISYGQVDSSSKTRFEIIDNSLAAIDEKDVVFGKGLGIFNSFYTEVGDKQGVAAHNNYLLFFIEGGIIALVTYLLFEFIMLFKLFRAIKNNFRLKHESDKKLIFATATVFIGIEFLGFLLNNYYFYQSEIIIWLLLGFSYPIIDRKVNIHE
tara:strand:- start:1146 stop:2435 length:1290 start_codon:yes stop_codon:yes gene_type:complete